MGHPLVIVGGGLAAARAAEELRAQGFEGRIVMYAAERHLPYERPPLSKGYLLGNEARESLDALDPDWYAANDVDVRLGDRIRTLDPEGHTVVADSGEQGYERLLLATGAQPRPLAVDGEVPVSYLRTVEDSDALRHQMAHDRRLLIVGGGWIGLEAAAAARTKGAEVTMVETLDLPLLRVLGPEVAQLFADLHRGHGVDLRTGVGISHLRAEDHGVRAELSDGSTVLVDHVLAGVGVAPDVALAQEAGLAVDQGVLVDQMLRTSHPDVFAAGDVANALHPVLHQRIRVEHWDNAIQQGKVAARNLLGAEEPYARMPYFFSDQYDLGMEYVGHVGADSYDLVVRRGDADVWSAYWLKAGLVVAGMHANDWDAIDRIRELVGTEAIPEQL